MGDGESTIVYIEIADLAAAVDALEKVPLNTDPGVLERLRAARDGDITHEVTIKRRLWDWLLETEHVFELDDIVNQALQELMEGDAG